MGAFGNLVGDAVDAYNGKSSGTTLQSFLDKFSNSSRRYVDTLDPLTTFDIRFRFHPSLSLEDLSKLEKKSALGRVGSSLANSISKMVRSGLDNVTGGLFSAFKDGKAGSVKAAHDGFKYAGQHTVMEYLAPAHLLQGGEQWDDPKQANCPLDLNLGPYVQSVNIPMMKQGGDGKSQTMFGEFPVNGTYVQTDGTLQMSVVNTRAALHERIFYPWMRECTLPFWSYESQPYTTATVDIDFTKHNDVHYVFTGVRPIQIKTLEATQEASSENLTRDVTFSYDFMFVTSDMGVMDSAGSKLMSLAGGLLGGAGKMLNM